MTQMTNSRLKSEPDPATVYHRVVDHLAHKLKEYKQIEAQVLRTRPELRGLALDHQLMQSERLWIAMEALWLAFGQFADALCRPTVARWVRANLAPHNNVTKDMIDPSYLMRIAHYGRPQFRTEAEED
jgi:hypothetical protein